MDIVD